jgi:hypothetical protein
VTSCDNCKRWKDFGGKHGECRRNAPVAVITVPFEGTDRYTAWPRTEAKDWCGEFLAKREPVF